MEQNTEKLRTELAIARREIANLRSKVTSLKYIFKKEIELIRKELNNYQCDKCQSKKEIPTKEKDMERKSNDKKSSFSLKPIGYVKTSFSQKRAVPRQAIIGDSILSRIEISKDAFLSNSEQSLDGLEGFSHIWIFFIFHKNEPFYKPKVNPPRLNGKSVGVLSTRSPHRPNLIGMSLVKIDRVENRTIYFYGTDMIEKTPVVDIKPYIPEYDAPSVKENENVKIPDWIRSSNFFKVIFSEFSLKQIKVQGLNLKSIEEVLMHDPRSVYVRERYSSQTYTFRLNERNVICEFDDDENCVTVVRIE